MEVQLETSSMIMLQQATSGAGVFDGLVEPGRARATIGSGSAQVRLRARRLGADGNALQVAFVDPGRPLNQTVVREVGGVLVVALRRDGASFLATSDEVAAAINGSRLKYVAQGSGNGVVAPVAATSLTGGLDPRVVFGCQFKFAQDPNANAGLFYFDQINNQVVTQVEGTFAVASQATVYVQLVNLTEALDPIPAETSTFFAATLTPDEPSFVVTDARIQLLPYRALRVVCAAPGQARVHVRREAAHSTL